MPIAIPPRLAAHAGDPAWAEWLAGLPRLAERLLAEWDLAPDGDPVAGSVALVFPVRTGDGLAAALKITWPHPEAATEHLALRDWAGDGAVRLLRADPRHFALLLERADRARDLNGVDVFEAIPIVVGLYPRLHAASVPPQLRTLSSLAGEWAERMPRLVTDGRVPRRLAEQALSLTRSLADDPATDGTLVHTDLHYGNVLASLRSDRERMPWLAIDPKPLSGDPAYEIAPLLGDRWSELPPHRIRDGLLERLWVALDVSGFDEGRVRTWTIVREAVGLLEGVEGGNLDEGRLQRSVMMVKAMQR